MKIFKMTTLKSKASLRYISISPIKMQRVMNQIRGRTYLEAIDILGSLPKSYKAVKPVLNVLLSAASNAKEKNELEKAQLLISEARVDKAPVMKRFRPRARGRGFAIQKPFCHISISVQPTN